MPHAPIKDFKRKILAWYRVDGRHHLPWRETSNAYKILVSEVMLQQTQVSRVEDYYKRFLKEFPTVKGLAGARTSRVLKVWSGLGYNRRALNLKKAAEIIIKKHGGKFPRDVRTLEELPGVGPYTARAVSTFAWNKPNIFIETNIRRVFIHFFFDSKHDISDSDIVPLLQLSLPRKNIRDWYWALMDFGALALKRLPNPNRRSRSYSKQSKFEGSRRYARAKVLKYLLAKRSGVSERTVAMFMSEDKLLSQYSSSEILLNLKREGFVDQKKKLWKVAR